MNSKLLRGSGLCRRLHWRSLVLGVLLSTLTACGSQLSRVAATGEAGAAGTAVDQASSNKVSDVESELAKAEDRQLQAEAEERERRRQAEAEERERRRLVQERQIIEAEARAEGQRLAREEAERERRAAIAKARAQRKEKLDRVAALEQRIVEIQAEIGLDSEKASLMQQAITAAVELMDVLTEEVAKYELTDETGNTLEPLAKDLIAELKARKDKLVDQARGL
ncbi:MAG: hypothetical protein CMD92_00830 [Gammaproteobacteria bacterium]|nr:hypothetical protein [Gammaproteobacteria bacterium]